MDGIRICVWQLAKAREKTKRRKYEINECARLCYDESHDSVWIQLNLKKISTMRTNINFKVFLSFFLRKLENLDKNLKRNCNYKLKKKKTNHLRLLFLVIAFELKQQGEELSDFVSLLLY